MSMNVRNVLSQVPDSSNDVFDDAGIAYVCGYNIMSLLVSENPRQQLPNSREFFNVNEYRHAEDLENYVKLYASVSNRMPVQGNFYFFSGLKSNEELAKIGLNQEEAAKLLNNTFRAISTHLTTSGDATDHSFTIQLPKLPKLDEAAPEFEAQDFGDNAAPYFGDNTAQDFGPTDWDTRTTTNTEPINYELLHADPVEYWENYPVHATTPPRKHHANCLINSILEYCSKKMPTAMKNTLKYFTENGTTVQALINWCTTKKIQLRLFTGFSRFPYVELPRVNDKYPGISAVTYNNHFYMGTVPLNRVDNAPKLLDLMPGIIVNEINNHYDEDPLFMEFNEMRCGNFFYKAEEHITVKAMVGTDEFDKETRAQLIGMDISNSYFTCLNLLPDTCPIPIFSAMDDWKPYNGEPIEAQNYYLLPAEFFKTRVHRLDYRKNNLLTGLELQHIKDAGLLQLPEHGIYVKKPTYKTTVLAYKAEILKIATLEEEDDTIAYTSEASLIKQEQAAALKKERAEVRRSKIIKEFAKLYNGAIGKSNDRGSFMRFECNPDDQGLYKTFDKRAERSIIKEINDRGKVEGCKCNEFDNKRKLCEACKAAPILSTTYAIKYQAPNKYRYLNNRNFYNLVVAAQNVQIMRMIDAVGCDYVMRTYSDSIHFINSEERRNALAALGIPMKRDKDKSLTHFCNTLIPINALTLVEDLRQEISGLVKNVSGYQGAPGTGKTYEIQNAGKYDVAMAFTNAVARKIKGETIHSRLNLCTAIYSNTRNAIKRLAGKSTWVDEFSMLAPSLLNYIAILMQRTRVILSGDPNQCDAVQSDGMGGMESDGLDYNSMLMKAILGRLTLLSECKRSDKTIFNLYTGVMDAAGPQEVCEILAKYVNDNPRCQEYQRANFAIAHSNELRKKFNAYMLQKNGYTFTASSASVGVRLQCCKAIESLKLFKGSFYQITAASPAGYTLVQLEDGDSFGPLDICTQIKAAQLENFRPGYAITAFSSQGLTIRTPTIILGMHSMAANDTFRKTLYTALSRFADVNDLIITPSTPYLIYASDAYSHYDGAKRVMPNLLSTLVDAGKQTIRTEQIEYANDYDDYDM